MKRFARSRKRKAHQRRGLGIVWMSIFFLLLLAFAVFSIEYGWLRVAHKRAQAAADAAALAAADTLRVDRSTSARSATEIAELNPGTNQNVIVLASDANEGGDLLFGRWDEQQRRMEPTIFAPDAVQVSVRFQEGHPNGAVSLFLGRMFGLEMASVTTSSIAIARPREPVINALFLTNGFAPSALEIRQGGRLEASGAISVASDSPDAISIMQGGSVRAPRVTTEGGVQTDSDDSVTAQLRMNTPISEVPTYLPLPLQSLSLQKDVITGPGIKQLSPGRYPNGLVAAEGTYILEDGIYLFGGPGVQLSGAALLRSGNAIMALDVGANLTIDGGEIELTGPDTASSTNQLANWRGLALCSAPGAQPMARISQGGKAVVHGAAIMPTASVEVLDATLQADLVVAERLLCNHGVIDLGPPDPHPVDVFLVY